MTRRNRFRIAAAKRLISTAKLSRRYRFAFSWDSLLFVRRKVSQNMRLAALLILFVSLQLAATEPDTPKPTSGRRDDPEIQDLVEKLRNSQPPDWTYSDLASKSDLIVIAKTKSRAEIKWDDDIGGDFGKVTTKLVANRLRVLSVLKGKADDEIEVTTLEWKPNVIVLTNSAFAEFRTHLLLPTLVRVEIDGQVTGYAGSQPLETYKIEPEYLLYLRKANDDKYVPTTGQRYSAMSVRTLNN